MEKLQPFVKKYKQTIVYFYPKDNTPGCTLEAHDFSKNKELFKQKLNMNHMSEQRLRKISLQFRRKTKLNYRFDK
jgi:peroxiredoxin